MHRHLVVFLQNDTQEIRAAALQPILFDFWHGPRLTRLQTLTRGQEVTAQGARVLLEGRLPADGTARKQEILSGAAADAQLVGGNCGEGVTSRPIWRRWLRVLTILRCARFG